MQSYIKQRKIGSYLVNKTLIQHIEEYLTKDVPEILDWEDSEVLKQTITISLFDSLGEERLSSIKSHKHLCFRDDIKGITVHYKLEELSKELDITIRFGKEASGSDLSIHLAYPKAREKVSSIEDGLFSVLNQYKTFNWVFHPPDIFVSVLLLAAVITGIIALDEKYDAITKFFCAVAFWGIILFYIISRYVKMYSAFDTNRQKQLNGVFNWLMLGMASFIVFSTFATSIRRQLFGF